MSETDKNTHPAHELTIDEAWQELCEYSDRTSPEEYPDMALITMDELASFLERAKRAQITAGWTLVPVKPTQVMIQAAHQSHEGEAWLPHSLYTSMIAAAPAPLEQVPPVKFDGPELWEIVFRVLKGDVPDALTDEVFNQIAGDISKIGYVPEPQAAETRATSFQPTHRHTRRGTLYQVIAVAKMQSAHWVDESESSLQASVDYRLVVVYQGEEGGVWVRPYDEFNDGRFEVLPAFSGGEA